MKVSGWSLSIPYLNLVHGHPDRTKAHESFWVQISAIWEVASNLRKMSLEQWKELNKCGGLSLLETLSLAQIAETFKSSKTFGSLHLLLVAINGTLL